MRIILRREVDIDQLDDWLTADLREHRRFTRRSEAGCFDAYFSSVRLEPVKDDRWTVILCLSCIFQSQTPSFEPTEVTIFCANASDWPLDPLFVNSKDYGPPPIWFDVTRVHSRLHITPNWRDEIWRPYVYDLLNRLAEIFPEIVPDLRRAGVLEGEAKPPQPAAIEPAQPAGEDAPKIPSRRADLRKWKAAWRKIKPLVAEGKTNSYIEGWFPKNDDDMRFSDDTIIKIIAAGEKGLLD